MLTQGLSMAKNYIDWENMPESG